MAEKLPPTNWIEAKDNPFGIRILDCRSVSQGLLSTTGDPKIAELFVRLRSDRGEQYRGQSPANPLEIECRLTYANWSAEQDGPVFKAQEMEDKWDIYQYDGFLYFVRSWTGDVAFRSNLLLAGQQATITRIIASNSLIQGSRDYAVRTVDYLIKSHVYGQAVPHPIPAGLIGKPPQQLAIFSFSQFGRRGLYATYEDTTLITPIKDTNAD